MNVSCPQVINSSARGVLVPLLIHCDRNAEVLHQTAAPPVSGRVEPVLMLSSHRKTPELRGAPKKTMLHTGP
jgi:hypothetical protein